MRIESGKNKNNEVLFIFSGNIGGKVVVRWRSWVIFGISRRCWWVGWGMSLGWKVDMIEWRRGEGKLGWG